MSWYFDVTSKEYGTESFGPYPTEEEAVFGINRVKEQSERLGDRVMRFYSEPYEVKEGGEEEVGE